MAWWPAIRTRLAQTKCPINLRKVIDSYLTNRQIKLRYAGTEIQKTTNKGCIQGSIGGPILWNLLLDPLLKLLESKNIYHQAFADDIVLVFEGGTKAEIEKRANDTLTCVWEWGVQNKLKFAPQKTNAMILTKKLKFDTPRLSMGGTVIDTKNEIKILGLLIDNKLTFNKHVTSVCQKALNLYKRLSKAAKISWGLNPDIIRTIYTAVIEPIIMYAASVWHIAANKLSIQKTLNQVQRGFAQKICKAYKTVSLHSSLTIAGILPLDLRIHEAATLYETRRGITQPSMGDIQIEKRVEYRHTPHPAESNGQQFISLGHKDDIKIFDDHKIKIYTDGSKIEGGVGAALSLWSNEAEILARKYKLSSHCTVYQAELLAILKATEIILKNKETNFGIYSDSMTSLESISNKKFNNPLTYKIKKNIHEIKKQNKKLSLYWVKAHVGLPGNERADQLAKDAATKLKTKPEYDLCPISFIKRQIRLNTLDEWNRRYQTGETAAITKIFLPDPIKAYKHIKKTEITAATTQLLTGHGGFSAYLHRFKCKEDPSCPCEAGTDETIEHIIFECPIYSRNRMEAEMLMGEKIKRAKASELITNKTFVNYCCKIIKNVNNRNK